jgi:hypothetical protein
MEITYLGIWIANMALADIFINRWIADFCDNIGTDLFLSGWLDLGWALIGFGATMDSFGADCVVSIILTVFTVMMVGDETLKEITDNADMS